ncbi:patatin-like phospholipase family protein [Moheibacter sediminis]|uniref:Patatin-like phospholipase/acyl hydrolase n=1 Tax=Moheibacter sediminis TaxID=1434700 RepID=A0A1W1ZFS5_9FLAO|nr:patatin-like phospholipase family protein [Moheibacter sediminis]SMC46921.1 Patatin-like phospholipase/acyl hydrolase [Moheibacter sediminis]
MANKDRTYNKKIRILSLDGGGIRGIITCIILRYIEEQLQKYDDPNAKLGDYFDLISGSSTGGLIASILLVPNSQKKAKYSIEKALELYAEKGESIFNVKLWQKIINPFGVLDERISEKELEKQLNEFFGNLKLSEFIKPCLITSYDTENRRAKLFNTLDGEDLVDNFYVKDVCRATSAAPTYFEPAYITSLYGQTYTLIDGGVYANNPTLCAYAEARKIPFAKVLKDELKPDYPIVNEMIIISIGTGTVLKPYSHRELKNAGKIKWIQPLIDMLLSANAETVDYQILQMYETLGVRNKLNYHRINPALKNASSEMDNASKKNIEALIQAGLAYIDDNREELNTIVKKLISHK